MAMRGADLGLCLFLWGDGMKISEILRKAAMEHLSAKHDPCVLPSGDKKKPFACWACDKAEGAMHGKARDYFGSMLCPENKAPVWFSRGEKGQVERFMALLFAAEAAESEGL